MTLLLQIRELESVREKATTLAAKQQHEESLLKARLDAAKTQVSVSPLARQSFHLIFLCQTEDALKEIAELNSRILKLDRQAKKSQVVTEVGTNRLESLTFL